MTHSLESNHVRRNDGYQYRVTVGPGDSGTSVVGFLASRFSHSDRDQWLARIENEEVMVDQTVPDHQDILSAGSVISWRRPGWVEPAAPLSFETAFQDSQLVVVSKPSGLPTLPGDWASAAP